MSAQPSAPPLSRSSSQDPLSGRLQELGEELQCPLCIDFFEDPVVLPLCQHSFCRECIRGAVRPCGGGRNRQEIECPLCRKKTQLTGSVDLCVRELPRNFHLAGIIDKFRATEIEKQRAEEKLGVIEQRQVLELIEETRREAAGHENRQRQQQQVEQQQQQQQVDQQHQQQQQQQQQLENRSQNNLQPSPDFGQLPSWHESVSFASETPSCKKCPFPGVIRCRDCGEDFCLQCQQTHTHGESISFQEFPAAEAEKTGPLSLQADEEQQQELQRLQQKQQALQLQVEQQQVLSDFSPSPEWQRQQSDRWEELQEKKGTRRQASEDYPPAHQTEDVSQEPFSWPLSHQTQQAYPHPDLSLQSSSMGYPNPYSETNQNQFSPPPSLTPSSQLSCSHCTFPAAVHCKQCSSYFCWQCKGTRHDSGGAAYASHNMASMTGPCTLGTEQFVQNSISMVGLMNAVPVVATPVTETNMICKTPYTCSVKGMGPGKKITVVGKPYETDKRKCNFLINLMCNNNQNIALHFNPRFSWPKMVVRNSKVAGKYGSEERGGPAFPFKVGRPFRIEILCFVDKFEVNVDRKLFITYAHRIKDLPSINFLNVKGDVEITSVSGCS